METISSEELTEWAAYYQIDPWGTHRADIQAGVIASTVANVHAKRGHTFTPADFLPKFGPQAPKASMTAEEIKAKLSLMFKRAS